jgi:hypothetical protein
VRDEFINRKTGLIMLYMISLREAGLPTYTAEDVAILMPHKIEKI